MRSILLLWLFFAGLASGVLAQSSVLTIATVTRPPFSMPEDEGHTGFSVELWETLAADLGFESEFLRVESFSEMLDLVERGAVDGAIANISITSEREAKMDFTQPIFESGLQIMTPFDGGGPSLLEALLTRDILYAGLIALGLLFGSGMLMRFFERGRPGFFDRPVRQSLFPSFWWALNLVVNGGFEERMPSSRLGRMFAVLLVIGSLFLVSVFVAKITAALTVDALQSKIESLDDLNGKRVGTLPASTAAAFLDQNGIGIIKNTELAGLYEGLETGRLDAVFFDSPILAYYAQTEGAGKVQLTERVFKRENYGMALPEGSPLREQIDRGLLKLREDGTYRTLMIKWFGSAYAAR